MITLRGMSTKTPITIGIDASRAFVKDPAGPEYYSLHLIANIAKVDSFNHYKLYIKAGQRPNLALPHNFELVEVRLPQLPDGKIRLWTQVGLAIETILRPPDVLFIPAHTLPILSSILLPHVKILVTIHGLEGKYLPQSGNFLTHIYRNWSITWAVKLADKLIAVSQNTKNDVINTYNINHNKIQVVHEGVNVERFSSLPKRERGAKNISTAHSLIKNYREGKSYILFVGTVQPRKNLVRLIKAFSILSKSLNKRAGVNENLMLVIAGKLGWMYERILNAPKKFGVEARVKFIGRVDDKDLPGLYKGARAFILPSVTEGFGLPILEAQASGVPVVASRAGAIPEVAGNGAVFVNPLSSKSIANGMKKVLTNERLRRKLTERGFQNVCNFTWEEAARNTVKVITGIMGKKN